MKRIVILILGFAALAMGQTVTPWEAGVAWVEPGGTVQDNYDGVIPWSNVVVTGPVDVAKPGTYPVHYSVRDSSGNEGVADRTVTVADTRPPVLVLRTTAVVTLVAGTPLWGLNLGAVATDAFAGAVPVVMAGAVSNTRPGTYVLTFNATDPSGNKAVAITQTVIVTAPPDTTNPVITLK